MRCVLVFDNVPVAVLVRQLCTRCYVSTFMFYIACYSTLLYSTPLYSVLQCHPPPPALALHSCPCTTTHKASAGSGEFRGLALLMTHHHLPPRLPVASPAETLITGLFLLLLLLWPTLTLTLTLTLTPAPLTRSHIPFLLQVSPSPLLPLRSFQILFVLCTIPLPTPIPPSGAPFDWNLSSEIIVTRLLL